MAKGCISFIYVLLSYTPFNATRPQFSFPDKPRVPHSIILLLDFIPTNTVLIVRLVQANLHSSFLRLPWKIVNL